MGRTGGLLQVIFNACRAYTNIMVVHLSGRIVVEVGARRINTLVLDVTVCAKAKKKKKKQ